MRTRQLRPPGRKSRGGRRVRCGEDNNVVSVSITSSSSGPGGLRTGCVFCCGPGVGGDIRHGDV